MRRATLLRVTGAFIGAAVLVTGAADARISTNPLSTLATGDAHLMSAGPGAYKPITAPTITNVAGVPYQTISDLRDVRHLAALDSTDVLILTGKSSGPPWLSNPVVGPVNLQTIPLP